MPVVSRIIIYFILLGLLAYHSAFFNPFIHDDLFLIRFNPNIANLGQWATVFLAPSNPPSFIPIANTYYRPLLEIMYRLLFKMAGFYPPGYHFFNVVIHIVNAIILFFIIKMIIERVDKKGVHGDHKTSSGNLIGWFLTSIFLVHPVQTESVACISGMSNLIFSFFCLISLGLFFMSSPPRLISVRYFFCLILYLLALLIKEQAIFFPFLILLCVVILNEHGKIPFKEKLCATGFFAISILYLIWRRSICGVLIGSIFKYKGELLLRLQSIPQTLLMYVRILLVPYDLHYYRSVNILNNGGLLHLGALILIGVGIFILLKRMPSQGRQLAWLGLGWFLISLLPVLNIIPLVHEYSWIAAFEHFLYFPLIGFLIFMGGLLKYFLSKDHGISSQRICIALAAFVIIIFSHMTYLQNFTWRHAIPLFKRAVAYEPNIGRIRILLSRAYISQGQCVKAQKQLGEAAKVMDGYLRKVELPAARTVYWHYLQEIDFLMDYCSKRMMGG